MVKVQVIEDFRLSRFNELKNIQRKSKDVENFLFKEDIFECDEELAKYLIENNKEGRAFVKVIEVMPKKEIQKAIDNPVKKETKSRKTIAKK